MEVLIFITAILAAGTVCFALKKHKHKKSGRHSAENELEQLNILLQNIEAYGKSSCAKKKDGDGR